MPGRTINQHHSRVDAETSVDTELGIITGSCNHQWPADTTVDVWLRSNDIVTSDESGISVEIINKVFSGNETQYTLQLPSGKAIEYLTSSNCVYTVGERITVKAKVVHLITFEAEKDQLAEN